VLQSKILLRSPLTVALDSHEAAISAQVLKQTQEA
jgi:hypothetical protein